MIRILVLFLVLSDSGAIEIEKLGYSKEKIPTLTTEICDMKPDIQHLRLWGYEMTKINVNALRNCNQVTNIWLEDNLLTVIYSGTFQNKPKLTELSVRQNLLEYLDEDVFDGLRALENLNLRCNKLIFFSPRHVQDLINLKYLNLASNDLINLEINGILDKLPLLGFINYNGNDISCSRHAIISAKINATNVNLGDLTCVYRQIYHMGPDLIESTTKQYSSEPYYCMPDDKWELRSTEVIARIDELKKKYNEDHPK